MQYAAQADRTSVPPPPRYTAVSGSLRLSPYVPLTGLAAGVTMPSLGSPAGSIDGVTSPAPASSAIGQSVTPLKLYYSAGSSPADRWHETPAGAFPLSASARQTLLRATAPAEAAVGGAGVAADNSPRTRRCLVCDADVGASAEALARHQRTALHRQMLLMRAVASEDSVHSSPSSPARRTIVHWGASSSDGLPSGRFAAAAAPPHMDGRAAGGGKRLRRHSGRRSPPSRSSSERSSSGSSTSGRAAGTTRAGREASAGSLHTIKDALAGTARAHTVPETEARMLFAVGSAGSDAAAQSMPWAHPRSSTRDTLPHSAPDASSSLAFSQAPVAAGPSGGYSRDPGNAPSGCGDGAQPARAPEISVLSITNDSPPFSSQQQQTPPHLSSSASHGTTEIAVAPGGAVSGDATRLSTAALVELLQQDEERRRHRTLDKKAVKFVARVELNVLRTCLHHWYRAMFVRTAGSSGGGEDGARPAPMGLTAELEGTRRREEKNERHAAPPAAPAPNTRSSWQRKRQGHVGRHPRAAHAHVRARTRADHRSATADPSRVPFYTYHDKTYIAVAQVGEMTHSEPRAAPAPAQELEIDDTYVRWYYGDSRRAARAGVASRGSRRPSGSSRYGRTHARGDNVANVAAERGTRHDRGGGSSRSGRHATHQSHHAGGRGRRGGGAQDSPVSPPAGRPTARPSAAAHRRGQTARARHRRHDDEDSSSWSSVAEEMTYSATESCASTQTGSSHLSAAARDARAPVTTHSLSVSHDERDAPTGAGGVCHSPYGNNSSSGSSDEKMAVSSPVGYATPTETPLLGDSAEESSLGRVGRYADPSAASANASVSALARLADRSASEPFGGDEERGGATHARHRSTSHEPVDGDGRASPLGEERSADRHAARQRQPYHSAHQRAPHGGSSRSSHSSQHTTDERPSPRDPVDDRAGRDRDHGRCTTGHDGPDGGTRVRRHARQRRNLRRAHHDSHEHSTERQRRVASLTASESASASSTEGHMRHAARGDDYPYGRPSKDFHQLRPDGVRQVLRRGRDRRRRNISNGSYGSSDGSGSHRPAASLRGGYNALPQGSGRAGRRRTDTSHDAHTRRHGRGHGGRDADPTYGDERTADRSSRGDDFLRAANEPTRLPHSPLHSSSAWSSDSEVRAVLCRLSPSTQGRVRDILHGRRAGSTNSTPRERPHARGGREGRDGTDDRRHPVLRGEKEPQDVMGSRAPRRGTEIGARTATRQGTAAGRPMPHFPCTAAALEVLRPSEGSQRTGIVGDGDLATPLQSCGRPLHPPADDADVAYATPPEPAWSNVSADLRELTERVAPGDAFTPPSAASYGAGFQPPPQPPLQPQPQPWASDLYVAALPQRLLDGADGWRAAVPPSTRMRQPDDLPRTDGGAHGVQTGAALRQASEGSSAAPPKSHEAEEQAATAHRFVTERAHPLAQARDAAARVARHQEATDPVAYFRARQPRRPPPPRGVGGAVPISRAAAADRDAAADADVFFDREEAFAAAAAPLERLRAQAVHQSSARRSPSADGASVKADGWGDDVQEPRRSHGDWTSTHRPASSWDGLHERGDTATPSRATRDGAARRTAAMRESSHGSCERSASERHAKTYRGAEERRTHRGPTAHSDRRHDGARRGHGGEGRVVHERTAAAAAARKSRGSSCAESGDAGHPRERGWHYAYNSAGSSSTDGAPQEHQATRRQGWHAEERHRNRRETARTASVSEGETSLRSSELGGETRWRPDSLRARPTVRRTSRRHGRHASEEATASHHRTAPRRTGVCDASDDDDRSWAGSDSSIGSGDGHHPARHRSALRYDRRTGSVSRHNRSHRHRPRRQQSECSADSLPPLPAPEHSRHAARRAVPRRPPASQANEPTRWSPTRRRGEGAADARSPPRHCTSRPLPPTPAVDGAVRAHRTEWEEGAAAVAPMPGVTGADAPRTRTSLAGDTATVDGASACPCEVAESDHRQPPDSRLRRQPRQRVADVEGVHVGPAAQSASPGSSAESARRGAGESTQTSSLALSEALAQGEPGAVYVLRGGRYHRLTDSSMAALHAEHHEEPLFVVVPASLPPETDARSKGGRTGEGPSADSASAPSVPPHAAAAAAPAEKASPTADRAAELAKRDAAPTPQARVAECVPSGDTPSGAAQAPSGPRSATPRQPCGAAPLSASASSQAARRGCGSPVGCGRLNPYCSVCRARFNLVYVDAAMRPVRWRSPRVASTEALGAFRLREGLLFGGPAAQPLLPLTHLPPSPAPAPLRASAGGSGTSSTPPVTAATPRTSASASLAQGMFVPVRFHRSRKSASPVQYHYDSLARSNGSWTPALERLQRFIPTAQPHRTRQQEERQLRQRMKRLLRRDLPAQRGTPEWDSYLRGLGEDLQRLRTLQDEQGTGGGA